MSLQEWAAAQRTTLALVFTDIVGSTALTNKLGDEQWIRVIMAHVRRARFIMKDLDCYEIKMIGDAFMVAFRTVDDALDFSVALQDIPGHYHLKVRAGIHVGSVYIA